MNNYPIENFLRGETQKRMNNPQKPTARQAGLVIQEMPEEVLVFDLETNKAHCLNETAAFVWKSCDGSRSAAQIAELFGRESGKNVEEEMIWLAIDQLSENNLLEQKIRADFKNQTRREVIKKIGLAAVIALPLVSSLVAPTAARAVACSGVVASCTNGGVTCNDGTPCSSCTTSPANPVCRCSSGVCTSSPTRGGTGRL